MMAIKPKYYFVVRLSPLHVGGDDYWKDMEACRLAVCAQGTPQAKVLPRYVS